MHDSASLTPAMSDAASVATIKDEVEAQITLEQHATPESPLSTNFAFKGERDDDDETMAEAPSNAWISLLGGLFNSIDDAAFVQQ
jgi:hypothetical protein